MTSATDARPIIRLLLLTSLLSVSAGCDSDGDDGGPSEQVQLTVFAASSLTDAFEAIEKKYEEAHPNVDVALDFAGSQTLRLQLEQGAEADVFASANEGHMRALVDVEIVPRSQLLAHNALVVIVPRDNPAGIASFDDLPKADRLVVGADTVPVGLYADAMLEQTRSEFGGAFAEKVRDRIVSQENNVRLVRAKVELGEADAAVVYRTDAVSSDEVEMVDIPSEVNTRANYVIGPLASAPHPELARDFIDFATSRTGRDLLERQGFDTETPPR